MGGPQIAGAWKRFTKGEEGPMYAASNLEDVSSSFARDLSDWASVPQYTICCMNGSAMGAGVGLACCCDLVVAVRSAHMTLSEIKLGIIPADISPHILRSVGPAHAKKLFTTAENCSMNTAVNVGLVQRVVNDASEFPAVIREYAQKIQGLGPAAVAASKRAILNCLYKAPSTPMCEWAANVYTQVRKDEECDAAMKALASKKRPDWVLKKIDVKDA